MHWDNCVKVTSTFESDLVVWVFEKLEERTCRFCSTGTGCIDSYEYHILFNCSASCFEDKCRTLTGKILAKVGIKQGFDGQSNTKIKFLMENQETVLFFYSSKFVHDM